MIPNRWSVAAAAGIVAVVALILGALLLLGWALMTVATYALPDASPEVRLAVVVVAALIIGSLGGRSR